MNKMFATCHGVYIIENEKCGDQLDVSMEEFSGWEMKNSENPNIKFTTNYQGKILEVLKIFEFEI